MGWPVFSEKELIIGNLESRVGVCTLWSPRENFAAKHLSEVMNKIAVVGNLYSVYGIGILIRNYLANQNMRYLIVTGTALGGSKAALERLGCDSSLPPKLFLSERQVARFLDQVKILFCAKGENAADIVERDGFSDDVLEKKEFIPEIIDLPKPKAEMFPGPQSGYLIRVKTISEGYTKLLNEIRRFGHITGKDSEGHRRQEIWELNMVITDQNPLDFAIPHPEYEEERVKKYCEDFWNGTEPQDLAYRYGHIIRFGFGDQVEAVIGAMKKKAETFRTVISLWNPDTAAGSIVAEDPPCITTINSRIIGDKMYLWAYIRTNDMFGGWPLNAMALRYFQFQLLKRAQEELKRPELQMGDLGITSGSAHLYERDWHSVDSFLSEKRATPFVVDPKGGFEVETTYCNIKVRHFSPDGALLQEFEGLTEKDLRLQLEPYISQIGHALYLGAELKAAETRLRSKEG